MFKIFCSSKALPIICNPLASWPAGIEIPGKPAKFTGTVKISFKSVSYTHLTLPTTVRV